jgi:hypothetical protein
MKTMEQENTGELCSECHKREWEHLVRVEHNEQKGVISFSPLCDECLSIQKTKEEAEQIRIKSNQHELLGSLLSDDVVSFNEIIITKNTISMVERDGDYNLKNYIHISKK